MAKAQQTRESVHEGRDQELREAEPVHEEEDEVWEQNLALNFPAPRKGFRQRAIRIMLGDKIDHRNIAKKLQDGWKPRDPATVPNEYDYPRIETGRFAGFLGIEDGVLMEMPEKRAMARQRYYADITKNRSRVLDAQVQQITKIKGGHGIGNIEIDEKSSREGRLRKVSVAEDTE